MEFRELMTEVERNVFIARLKESRIAHRSGFRQNSRSQSQSVNRHRFACSQLYGLFENETAPADTMIAGIIIHDLISFPQSCSKPDLSHFPARTVVECSDHWSLSPGGGILVWAGMAIPFRLLGVKAVLAYLDTHGGSSEHAGFYTLMGFIPVGYALEHPFVENADGEKLLVQPMVLQGEALINAINVLSEACIRHSDNGRIFELKKFIWPLVRRASVRS